MVGTTDVNVQINNKSECVYTNTHKVEGNNLNSLLSHLKTIQQNVNSVLTKLVEAEKNSNQGNAAEISEEDDDNGESDDEEEDNNSKPKKCKYK